MGAWTTKLAWGLVPLAATLALAACSADETPAEADTVAGTDGTDPGDTTEPVVCDDTSAEDFVILFGYRYRIPGTNEYDVNMMYPIARYEPQPLTDFSLKAEGKTCEYGCLVDDSVEWIAVNGAAPDQKGFDFQMGRFNDCLEVSLVKGGVLEDKTHFTFAKDFVYYSEQLPGCTGPSCQYSIWRINLETLEKQQLIPAFPPAEDPDWINGDSTYKGRFRVSPDGESLVLLSPTIRSQRVYIWSAGTLHQVDYLCDNLQNETCIGAGSAYSDTDPVAISPDSKEVVLFSVNSRALRLRRYSTENPDDKGFTTFLSVETVTGGDYNAVACSIKEDWQFTHVVGNPSYTPDGEHLVFAGRSDCGQSEKSLTNIYRIRTDIIGDSTPQITESELVNLTNNPGGDVPTNIEIASLTLSPDGKRIIFTGTPKLTSSWQPMSPTVKDDRQFTDAEVYMVSICGGEPQQLTSNVSYKASSPQAVPLPDLSKCQVSPLPDPQ